MTVKYLLNNYQVGAKLKSAPIDKAEQKRIDSKHVEVIFNGLTTREYEFCNKLFAKRGIIIQ